MLELNMRIISGSKRGKKLIEKIDETTRPTTDRVRENVFNVLANLVEFNRARVLDLFAGSGGYGLEAYSRGATETVFNDCDTNAIATIKKNCVAVGCKATVLCLDFRQALEQLKSKKFDIIFIDPPYESDYVQTAFEIICQQEMLSHDGIIVIESGNQLTIPSLISKNYGRAWLYFVNPGRQLPR